MIDEFLSLSHLLYNKPSLCNMDPPSATWMLEREFSVHPFDSCRRSRQTGDIQSKKYKSMAIANAQNPSHTFPRNFPVDEEVANLLRTCRLCWGLAVVLLRESRQLITDLLQGNWCNGEDRSYCRPIAAERNR